MRLGTLALIGGGAALLYVASHHSLEQQVDASVLKSLADLQRSKLRAAGLSAAQADEVLIKIREMRSAGYSDAQINQLVQNTYGVTL